SQSRKGASQPRSGAAQSARTGPTSSTSDTAKAHSAGSAARLLSGGGAMRRSRRATLERSGAPVASSGNIQPGALCHCPTANDRAPVDLGLGGDCPRGPGGLRAADGALRRLFAVRFASSGGGAGFPAGGRVRGEVEPLLALRSGGARSV